MLRVECKAFETSEILQQLPILRECNCSMGHLLFVCFKRKGCALQLGDANTTCPQSAPGQGLEIPQSFNKLRKPATEILESPSHK